MSLNQWLENSWISKVERSAGHVQDLLAIAARQLADASLQGISVDGRFNHAYDAVRTCCEVMLHAEGYMVCKGVRQHERAIESLRFTLGGKWTADIDFLDRCRRIRNESVYDRPGRVQSQDANDLLKKAGELREAVLQWLSRFHADLLPDA